MPNPTDEPPADPPPDADAAVVEGDSPPSERVPLERDRIVDAALDLVEQLGPGNLTMRRLGHALGVEAMSLYRYVPGKEELLDSVVDRLIETMYADDDVLSTPRDGWQDFLQRMAHGVRRVAIAHPKSFPLVASRPPEAPWLRPPLRSLDWVESFVGGLRSEGFSREGTASAYRAFTSFLLGSLLLEVAARGADVGPLDVVEDTTAESSLADYPGVDDLRHLLAQDRAADEFELALEDLLDRIARIKVDTQDAEES
ncbi:putative transcriptional regulator, TetR family protein [Marmoricola endophyticus]|uniref:Transcriptional regulator, TetR family protein n=1 Tax=Marmoricola endophyticus TaxID=2040280 RepID=A0A917BNN1_9ACTN|nr:TetR/AcrR family transcriptional regulator C-terminal domain-containing protein [Marmoricola endophyticus]GGF50219.1 putative transcriptional regulator, TetR family protein [Marmoricola endophyticus]